MAWEPKGAFLGWGVGEGSVRVLAGVAAVTAHPRGVAVGEGVCFAARGGLILSAMGVTGAALGVAPETVRFLPVVGVEQRPSSTPCGSGRMRSSAAALRI